MIRRGASRCTRNVSMECTVSGGSFTFSFRARHGLQASVVFLRCPVDPMLCDIVAISTVSCWPFALHNLGWEMELLALTMVNLLTSCIWLARDLRGTDALWSQVHIPTVSIHLDCIEFELSLNMLKYKWCEVLIVLLVLLFISRRRRIRPTYIFAFWHHFCQFLQETPSYWPFWRWLNVRHT